MIKVKSGVYDLFTLLKPLVKNKEVLDLGCVQHNLLNSRDFKWLHGFLKKQAKYLLGVDYLKEDIVELKRKGYNVICSDVQKMKIDRQFDVIVAGELIEHLENPGLFIENAKIALKPNGLLILTFPNPYALSKIKSCLLKFTANPIINPEHTCWFTPNSISELLRRYSFKVVDAYHVSKKGTLQNMLCRFVGGRFQGSFMIIAKFQ